MARASKLVLLSLFVLAWAGVAFAGTQDLAVVALHEKPHASKAINICPSGSAPEDPVSAGLPCSSFSVDNAPTFAPRDVYLVVARGNQAAGLAGLSCGIAYTPLVGMFGWTLCSDLDFPNGSWPANGGGDRITWSAITNCQNTDVGGEGVHAVAGAFYIYTYGDGTLSVTPNNNLVTPEFRVADCNASESNVTVGGGEVGFGAELGFNPCDIPPVPTEDTSWGSVKSRFE